MARAKFFSNLERDFIRVGLAMGRNAAQIARAIGRTDTGVRNQIRAMKEAGTINDLPLPCVARAYSQEMDQQRADQ